MADELHVPDSWEPPALLSPCGALVVSAPVVVESFARGDRVYVRGDVLERKDPAVRAVRRCVTDWSPPAIATSAPDMRRIQ